MAAVALAVDIRGLSFTWRGASQPTLRTVTFLVTVGEKVAILGPNGAGKSTLLAFLNGAKLASPPVRVCGVDVDAKSLASVRRKVGVVLQDADDQLFMPTVREDVAFGPMNAGLSRGEVASRVQAALTAVDALPLVERVHTTLSGGERRRVSIATVLSMDVELVALDEPTSNLDARGRRAVTEVLKALSQTLIVATHDLALVAATCSRCVILDNGEIVADRPMPEMLADRDLLLAHGII